MAKTPPKVERYHNSRYEHRTIKFAQIVTEKERDLSHRDEDAFKDDRIEPLSASLVQEDLATPLTVYETGKVKKVDGKDEAAYGLAGGKRRHRAIEGNIADNIDPHRFHPGMEVPVVVLVRGEHQSQESYEQDILVNSVLENEQRASFTQPERLKIVAQFVAAKVPKPRAASALAMSQTNYDRYARVVRLKWLHLAVLDGKISLTDAAKLAEAAEKHKRLRQFQAEFEKWAARKQALLDHERAEQKKLGRELKGPAAQLKKYLNAEKVKVWESCLTDGRPFMESAGNINFGVVIDETKRSLEMTKVSKSWDELTSDDVTEILAELATATPPLLQLRNRLRIQEQAAEMSAEQVEQEIARLQELVRERAAKKAEAEAGREPQDEEGGDEAPPQDIGAEIEATLSAIQERVPGPAAEAPAMEEADDADGGDGDDTDRQEDAGPDNSSNESSDEDDEDRRS